MRQLKEILPLLKIGADKGNYPIYASYLNSKNGVLTTYNQNVYISLNKNLGYDGDTNIYVLDNIVSKIEDSFDIKKVGDTIVIESDNYKSELIVMNMGFPTLTQPKCDLAYVDEEFTENINLALKFAGSEGVQTYVYVDENRMYSYSNRKFLVAEHSLLIKEPFGINRTIAKTLTTGVGIGINNQNVIVEYGQLGFGIFSCYSMDNFPNKAIIKEYNKSISGKLSPICFVAALNEAIDKVSPVLYKEREPEILLYNKNFVLTVQASSPLHGTITSKLESELEFEMTIQVNPKFLKIVPDALRIAYNFDNPNRLVCMDKGKTIIIDGE